MSQSTSPTSSEPNDELTDDERELFERLAAKHEDDEEVSRICEMVLQSSADNEEANS
ncbi:kinesin protein family member [Natrialba magadii ATCC 43099]|uniref:Kinesin protein family member n=1 Tax=Natrialba magadii (strain ATCC 43099 / DSM 3394 / CCM 3739 / CIP 104546 / IAM 13178 / JCM 8861 / NBRC 102185 / NCIMB 2190 / MS3) TaxID=547559 RepID=D3SUC4_NATMM|nr:hypothetical protein [Natrialba magadii]ADD05182.1 kinesin protein family member [Natrialba magadii ATCC 43099]ELY23220.1 kinesin protein family member [Natrialba magadii ATCC 43099]